MTPTAKQTLPLQGIRAGFRRFSVREYHKMIEIGVLTEDDNLELIEGYLVHKMSRNPPLDSTLSRLTNYFYRSIHAPCGIRCQMAITLADSEPEPDLAIVRTVDDNYESHHPTPSEIYLVIEVADSTLDSDRIDKARIYARAGIPTYWIVNLVDRRIEVYSGPSGPTAAPAYGRRTDYAIGTSVPVVFGGVEVAQLPVAQVLS
jgi:Uma2 family endonuclease